MYVHHHVNQRQLRSVLDSLRIRRRSASRTRRKVTELEDQVDVVALALLSLISALVEKGVLTEDEIFDHLNRVDQADGVADGRSNAELLRRTLGLEREPAEPEAPTPSPKRRR